MCNSCSKSDERNMLFPIDIPAELELLEERLESLKDLQKVYPELPKRQQSFAASLLSQYYEKGSLSNKQWHHVPSLVGIVQNREPIYGSFKAILVMFRIAASNDNGKALKRPKVRLITSEDTYVTLVFNPEETSEVLVYTGGYSSHGKRLFAGWIHEDNIVPYAPDRMTEDVKLLLQEFSLDPQRTALAMAKKLGVCMYCNSTLTDEVSKEHGYGPVCAANWGLPHGNKSNRPPQDIDLNSLFS